MVVELVRILPASPIAAIEVVGRIARSVGRGSDVRSCRSLLAVAEAGRRSHSCPVEAVNRMQPVAAEVCHSFAVEGVAPACCSWRG